MRITSGKLRSRILVSPKDKHTHPMGDREKLALFNSLDLSMKGLNVLDLYAGSGALGLETISRGSHAVTFVEKSPKAIKAIKENAELLDVSKRTRIFPISVQEFLARSLGKPSNSISPKNRQSAKDDPHPHNPHPQIDKFEKYDLILIDPPYDDFRVEQFAAAEDLLAPDGFLVLSHPGLIAPVGIFERLNLITTRKYASAHISIYQK